MYHITKIVRKILVLAIAVFLIFISWIFVSSNIPQPASLIAQSLLGEKEMVIHGVRLVEKKNNNKTLEIKAERAVIFSGEDRTDLENFTMHSVGGKSGSITLIAGKGTLNNANNNMSAEGGVIVRDEKDRTLITDSLDWRRSENEIRTDDIVRLFGRGFIIKGRGMLVKVQDESFELLNEVTAIFNVE